MPYFHRKSDEKEDTGVCATSVFISPVLPFQKTESYDYKGCKFVSLCVCVVSHLTRPQSGLSFLDTNPHPHPLYRILKLQANYCN